MTSAFDRIPEPQREAAQGELDQRAAQRRLELETQEKDLCASAAQHGQAGSPELAEAISNLHSRHLQDDFEDRVATWVPLMFEHGPDAVAQLRQELLEHIPHDPALTPSAMSRFLEARPQIFERFLQSRLSTFRRFVGEGRAISEPRKKGGPGP